MSSHNYDIRRPLNTPECVPLWQNSEKATNLTNIGLIMRLVFVPWKLDHSWFISFWLLFWSFLCIQMKMLLGIIVYPHGIISKCIQHFLWYFSPVSRAWVTCVSGQSSQETGYSNQPQRQLCNQLIPVSGSLGTRACVVHARNSVIQTNYWNVSIDRISANN